MNNWLEFKETEEQKVFNESMRDKAHALRQAKYESIFKPYVEKEIIPSTNIFEFIAKNDLVTKWTMQGIRHLVGETFTTKTGERVKGRAADSCLDLVKYGTSRDKNGYLVFNREQTELYKECYGNVQLYIVELVNAGLLHFDNDNKLKIVFDNVKKLDKDNNEIEYSSYFNIYKVIRSTLEKNKHYQEKLGLKASIIIDACIDENGNDYSEKVISENSASYLSYLSISNDNDLLFYSSDNVYRKLIMLFDRYLKDNYNKLYPKLHKVWFSRFAPNCRNIKERASVSGLSHCTQEKYERLIFGTWNSKLKRRENGIVHDFKRVYCLDDLLGYMPKLNTINKFAYDSRLFHNPLGNRTNSASSTYREHRIYNYLDIVLERIGAGTENLSNYKCIGYDKDIKFIQNFEIVPKRKYALASKVLVKECYPSISPFEFERVEDELWKKEKHRFSKAAIQNIRAQAKRERELNELYESLNEVDLVKSSFTYEVDKEQGFVLSYKDGKLNAKYPIYHK